MPRLKVWDAASSVWRYLGGDHARSHDHSAAADGQVLQPGAMGFLRGGSSVGRLQIDSNGAALASGLTVESTAGQSNFLAIQVAGDTAAGLLLEADATKRGIGLGPGSAGRDVNIYRSVTKSLIIDSDGALSPLTEVQIQSKKISTGGANTLLQIGGSSFPASPATNDLFYRTDLGMWFFYNGSLWLSATVFEQYVDTTRLAALTGSGLFLNGVVVPRPGTNLIRSVSSQWVFSVAAGGSALDASNKWVLQYNYTPADAAVGLITINSGASGGTIRWMEETANAVSVPTGTVYGYLSAAKTGTPGNITVYGVSLSFRIVAT